MACHDVRTLDFDQCQYGSLWKKPTRIITGYVDPQNLDRLKLRCCQKHGGVCSRTLKRHLILRGRAPNGLSWTTQAAKYPTQFSDHIAFILSDEYRFEAIVNAEV